MIWEMVQAFRVFVMGLYYVSLPVYNCYTLHGIYIWIFFDIIGYIDLYIRMHVCYYDSNGILITHPRYTALRYLSHGFIIDIISLLPTTQILRLMTGDRGRTEHGVLRTESILRLNRLLQLYHIPQAFTFFERDIFPLSTVLINICKYIPVSIVVINAFATILLTVSCNMHYDQAGYMVLVPDKNSWIKNDNQFAFDTSEPFYMYLAAFYWLSYTALSLGFGDLGARQVSEIYFVIFVIVIGYLFFTHVLVVITSSKANININLSVYQEHMSNLISYMKRQRISRELQNIFGNLDNVQNIRSSISVVASKAVDLLCIDTVSLYVLAADCSIVIKRLHKHILTNNTSYIQVTPTVGEEMESYERLVAKMLVAKFGTLAKFNSLIYSGALRLPFMLMSFASCIVVTYHLAFQNHHLLIFILTYGLDVAHLFKLYINFVSPHQNKAGELVSVSKNVCDRFLTSKKFYLDLVTLLPLEIFALFAPASHMLYYLTLLRLNKLLRMWHIHTFFNVTFDRLNINVLVIKLGSICIYFILMVHIGTCLLYMIACPQAVCHKDSWIFDPSGAYKCSGTYICPLYFMITITTFSGFGDISPRTIAEVVTCIIIMLLGKFAMACFIGDMSAIVQIYSYTLVTYNYNSVTLKYYLKSSYITGPLVTMIMNYVNQLWTTETGHQIPKLLEDAPNYLLQDLKIAAYGKHLYENFLFASCHSDFLRLLIAQLKADTYFKGDIICQQGDINDKMYFIHKGIVNVYSFDGHENVQIDTLGELDCFSLVQGLIASTPHSHTYKAKTVAVILTLKLQDWAYLLGYYRASRFEIYVRIQQMANIYSDEV